MAKIVVSEKWLADKESRVLQGLEINEVLKHAVSQKALIALLARYNTPFKVINLGCGVKRITTNVNLCPKCGGTGKC